MKQFICYSRCGTCRKAQKWLDAHNIEYEIRPIKEDNPTLEELKRWYAESGLPLKKFFNTSGGAYRQLDLKNRLRDMSEEEQLRLLAKDGMLVRRPILVDGKKVIIGFDEKEYEGL